MKKGVALTICIGMTLILLPTKTEALEYLKSTNLYQSADSGDVESQYKLGVLYYNGDGKSYVYSREDGRDLPERDLREAYKWFQKARSKGHLGSTYYFALLNLRDPNGDFKLGELGANKEAGFISMKKAAAQGYALAQYELSKLYRDRGDDEAARRWEREAAKNGHTISKYNMALYDFHSEIQIAEEIALEIFNELAYSNAGRFGAYSMDHIAEAYFKGRGGLTKDPVQAYAWKSLFTQYYPSCDSSESFRQEQLNAYKTGLSVSDLIAAQDLAKKIKSDIESTSKSPLRRINFNCPNR